ncbi:carbohydrate-binding module family 50 protein [Xylaria grammica]|nr:carbohydrate-binding module family 50 protein [Xylaria grammica]
MLSHLVSLLVFITPTLGYLVDPPTTAPGDTIQDCTNWAVAMSSDTCESIADDNFISLSDLYIYNPSLSASSCPLIVGDSYCVEENFGVPPPPPTSSTTSSTTGNGISTPSPVQTGIASNCNKFYYVQDGDTCSVIAALYGITLAQFYAWNPAAGSTCATLGLHDYVCVGTLDATGTTTTTAPTTTTTKPGNGISTPTPVQTGIASNCNKFYEVQSGDICGNIVAVYGISLQNFYAWNPAVGSSCTTLIPGDYVCVGIVGFTTTTTTPTTTASLGNGIATPTPYQAGMVSDCDEFCFVKDGDTCGNIAADKGISVAHFYAWNPAAGLNTCKTLQAQTYACVGVQSCTTNTFGLVVPKPAGAICGISAVSNGGTTLVSYNSGTPVSSLVGCKNACLATVGCTNLYFTEGKACNLHAGAATHVASSTSAFKFYDSSCFVCPSKCLSASSPPASAICNVKAVSNGGTAIISYSSGVPIQNIQDCAATCLSTTGCTNLYFDPGKYCNLKAGPETHKLSSTSSYVFYEASCFQCASPSCWTDAQGLAVPQPSGAVCKVAAYSNGGTTIMSYSSGDPITSLKACSAACLATSGCTNLYYQAGKYCNLHSGADTHNPDAASPYLFYDASCFEC